MATFKPAHLSKGDVNELDQCIVDATFDCFSTTGLYKGKQVQVTTDKDSVVFSNGDIQLDVMSTVLCLKVCEVSGICEDDEIITCGIRYQVDKIIHNDGTCLCVTVTDCGRCQ